jgi:hypothetical protein
MEFGLLDFLNRWGLDRKSGSQGKPPDQISARLVGKCRRFVGTNVVLSC